MNFRLLYWFLFSFAVILSACGGSDDGLLRVDKAVLTAPEAQTEAMRRADSVAASIPAAGDPDSLYRMHLRAAALYRNLDLRLSLRYILRAIQLADSAGIEACEAQLERAALYNTQGTMVKDAYAVFETLDPAEMPPAARERYFTLGVQLNRSLADLSFDPELSDRYRRKANEYRDSVASLGANRPIVEANRLMENGMYAEAEHLIRSYLPDSISDAPEFGSFYHTLARILHLRGMYSESREALESAAVCDLRGGSRSYKALQELANELLELGDAPRAYRYIHRAASDAAACHARRRQLEIAASIPAIDAEYAAYIHRRTLTVVLICAGGLLLAAAVGVALIVTRRKNRILRESAEELRRAHDSLAEANAGMSQLNARLADEGKVKEEYITAFMELCLDYLKKMETYRAELGKIAARADWKKLSDTIASSRYVNKEIEQFFARFDNAFLALYPGFVPRLNSFLRPECRYPENTDRFTTELRIYALLWLGIDGGAEIARFLRCSESTVYNYRTRMRNSALDRNGFEADFLNRNS